MKISKRSQLGLRFNDSYNVDLIKCIQSGLQLQVKKLEKYIKQFQKGKYEYDLPPKENTNISFPYDQLIKSLINNEGSKYYLICDSVHKASELIKISKNFSGRAYKDIKLGKYTYLIGKNSMIRFIVEIGVIYGFYYDDFNDIAFTWDIDIETSEYNCNRFNNEFSNIMRILAFVELGDIEVIELIKGRNNGGKKNVDKITNDSNNTVYVVDSSWNKLIIRTEGFAVRGHFRMQPCGEEMRDRKLIWIDAFEKHGYTRRPKAEIVR